MVHFTGLMSSVFPLIFWNKWQLNYTPWWHREKIRSHCNRPGSWNWWRLLITSSSYWWFISAASKIFTKLKFLLASPQSCLYLHLYNFVCYHVCTLLSVCGWVILGFCCPAFRFCQRLDLSTQPITVQSGGHKHWDCFIISVDEKI